MGGADDGGQKFEQENALPESVSVCKGADGRRACNENLRPWRAS